ncbi:COG4-domain-containing protein [Sanghuangporus baumii]|uniref:Conserved oligomeric Golgi complex subunit 4 n=1 Tax=Sanghuangporus baumii TaxID=108892 RepID=A0A9Q5I476_SANBA|nr:COG4-domain-containing protein [Sanghuangporus baumii]
MDGLFQTRPHPSSLTTLPDILASLAALEEEESQLSESLAAILTNDEPVRSSLERLRALVPQLEEIGSDSELLANTIAATAQTAERVGGRVRTLDEEMKRVREAGERVSQVMELKVWNSLAELQNAIDSRDWETATRHCARATALPLEVISGPFAESAVPTAELPLPPPQTLQGFREQLRDIFLQQFAQASRARDSNMTTRFFKLLPSIGWEQEGLEAYASFVLTLVQSKSPATMKSSSPLYYVTALTALFESVCSILDQHQPVVEKYYGEGKMQTVVIYLVRECDAVVRRLLNGWEEDRHIGRMISETSTTSFASPTRAVSNALEEQSIDPRDVDKVLNEIAAMHAFLALEKSGIDMDSQNNNSATEESDDTDTASYSSHESLDSDKNIIEIIEKSACRSMFDDVLKRCYMPLETWYLRCTMNQAHRTSMIDDSQMPPVTTLPDIVFYILKSVFLRLVSTGSSDTVEGTSKHIREVLENDYISVIKRKLDESGIDQLFNQLIRPRLRNFIPEIYRDVSYVLDEDGFSASEYQDIVRKRFIKAWENIVDGFKVVLINQRLSRQLTSYCGQDSFTESNYRIFVGQVIDVLIRPWEKYVMTVKYTELGAIRFDQDIRAISTYLSSQAALGDIREKLQRLQQISTLLNIDKDEDVDDFYSSSGIAWKITMTEARAIAALKV